MQLCSSLLLCFSLTSPKIRFAPYNDITVVTIIMAAKGFKEGSLLCCRRYRRPAASMDAARGYWWHSLAGGWWRAAAAAADRGRCCRHRRRRVRWRWWCICSSRRAPRISGLSPCVAVGEEPPTLAFCRCLEPFKIIVPPEFVKAWCRAH